MAYNYRKAVREDIIRHLAEEGVPEAGSRAELVSIIGDCLRGSDVTGDNIRPYTDADTARIYLDGNGGLIRAAVESMGTAEDYERVSSEPEHVDTLIRWYVLDGCISEVIERMDDAVHDDGTGPFIRRFDICPHCGGLLKRMATGVTVCNTCDTFTAHAAEKRICGNCENVYRFDCEYVLSAVKVTDGEGKEHRFRRGP